MADEKRHFMYVMHPTDPTKPKTALKSLQEAERLYTKTGRVIANG